MYDIVVSYLTDYMIPFSVVVVFVASTAQTVLRGLGKLGHLNQDDWNNGKVSKWLRVLDKALELARAFSTGDWKSGKRLGQLKALLKERS